MKTPTLGRILKNLCIIIITSGTLALLIRFAFNGRVWLSLTVIGILYWLIHLLAIERYQAEFHNRLWAIALVLSTITGVWFFLGGRIAASAWALLAWFSILIRATKQELDQKIHPSIRSMLRSSNYIFTLCLGLSVGFFLTGIHKTTVIDCTQLQNISKTLTQTLRTPWWATQTAYNNTVDQISTFLNQPLGAILGISWETYTGVQKPKDTQQIQTGRWVLGYLEKAKTQIVDTLIKENSVINRGICSIIAERLDTYSKNPQLQIIAIALITLILSPIVSLVLLIITILRRLIIKFLFLIRFYQKVPTTKEGSTFE